jgi:hypothetical protein
MLSASSFQPTDRQMQNPLFVSLLPYIQGISPHSITYAGIEGFPWVAPHGHSAAMLDAQSFMPAWIAGQAADVLSTKKIWINTGTFSAIYTNNQSQTVTMTPQQRANTLATVDHQAIVLQKMGYSVAVNVFAQNKSDAAEATNWSYWNNGSPSRSSSTSVLTGFIQTLNRQHVDFWLFDQ